MYASTTADCCDSPTNLVPTSATPTTMRTTNSEATIVVSASAAPLLRRQQQKPDEQAATAKILPTTIVVAAAVAVVVAQSCRVRRQTRSCAVVRAAVCSPAETTNRRQTATYSFLLRERNRCCCRLRCAFEPPTVANRTVRRRFSKNHARFVAQKQMFYHRDRNQLPAQLRSFRLV